MGAFQKVYFSLGFIEILVLGARHSSGVRRGGCVKSVFFVMKNGSETVRGALCYQAVLRVRQEVCLGRIKNEDNGNPSQSFREPDIDTNPKAYYHYILI